MTYNFTGMQKLQLYFWWILVGKAQDNWPILHHYSLKDLNFLNHSRGSCFSKSEQVSSKQKILTTLNAHTSAFQR